MKNPFRGMFRRAPAEPDQAKAHETDGAGLRVTHFPADYQRLLHFYGVGGTHAAVYGSQPNIRTAVQTVSREAASLNIKTYMKDPRPGNKPGSRKEVADEAVAQLLDEPTPGKSVYGFWFETFADIEVYDIAYWRKIRVNGIPKALVRVPPSAIFPVYDIEHEAVVFQTQFGVQVPRSELVVFWGYDPAYVHGSISPMESIRRLLAEEIAADADREGRWRNSARKDGVIERHVDGDDMSDTAKEAFLLDVEDSLAGPGGSGRPLMLEKGMTWNDVQWSPRDMEYINARKLSRTEVAAHFHIPPAMVAAAANNAEADEDTLRYFYKHSLPPRLTRVEDEIEAQLLPDFYPVPKTRRQFYVEFNMDDKLRAAFEDRAKIMATTVGGPVVTVNEARARLNLPATNDPLDDKLYAPTNSIRGGGTQASPQNPTQTPATPAGNLEPAGTTPGGGSQRASYDPEKWLKAADEAAERKALESEQAVFLIEQRAKYEERARIIFERTFQRQKQSLNGQRNVSSDRWNRELADDLFGVMYQAAQTVGEKLAEIVEGEFDAPRTANLLKRKALTIAKATNDESQSRLDNETDPDDVFNPSRASTDGTRLATWVTGWTPMELAHQNGELDDGAR